MSGLLPAALPEALVFVDLETTGANMVHDRVTEVGVVEVRGDTVTEWSSLVNPGRDIPPFIQSLTGISEAMVADAPPFAALAAELRVRLHGALLVAHNARFDTGFLQAEYGRLGEPFGSDVLCTVKLSRRLFPEERHHRLDALVERHGLVAGERHRALADARLLWQFWQVLRAQCPAATLAQAVSALTLRAGSAALLHTADLGTLPQDWGVAVLLDAGGAALAVERASNLRARMGALLGGRARGREARLAEQVRRLDWVATGGELGALLAEARLVREREPLRGRRRLGGEPLTWVLSPVAGRLQARLAAVSDQDLGDGVERFGVFGDAAEASRALQALAEEHALCRVTLGLEPAQDGGGCRDLRQGRCRGACNAAEPLRAHDARTLLALAPLRLAPWPYPEPVIVREGGLVHVLHQWRHLGSAADPEALAALRETPLPPFDAETYRILRKCLPGLAVQALPVNRG